MADCKRKYIPESDYNIVKQRLLSGILRNFDYESWIRNIYSNADDLIQSIDKLLETGVENAIAVLRGQSNEIEGAFGPRFQIGQTAIDPEMIEVDSVPIGERRNEGLNIRSSFISEGNVSNPTEAYTSMINTFVKNVVEGVIYDPTAKRLIDPNFERFGSTKLNEFLYNRRLQLMERLWNVLHPDNPFTFKYTTDIEFTAAINRILSDYANKKSKLKDGNSVFAEYMMLKNFDAILESEFKNVFGLKPKYKNGNKVGKDMYDFLGGKVEHDTTWGDEYADASDYSGKLIKVLLNYFHGKVKKGNTWVDTNKSIGFATFCYLTSRVKEWAENSLDKTILNIVHGDVNSDWAALIDKFIINNSTTLTTDEIANLRGIQISLMSNDNPELKEMFINQAKKTVRYRYMVVKPSFNPKTGRMEMQSVSMEDRLIDRQNISVQKSVKNAVLKFKSENSAAKDNLKAVFNYEIADNKITIHGLGNEPVEIEYKLDKDKFQFIPTDSMLNVEDNAAARLIRMVIGQPIPSDIQDYMKSFPGYTNLLSVFIKPIALTLLASEDRFKNTLDEGAITFTDGILNTWKYTDIFYPSAQLMSKIFATTDTNVVRNEDGNALPSYQIISSIYNVKEWIYRAKNIEQNLRSGTHDDTKSNVIFSDNVLYRDHKDYLGTRQNITNSPIGAIYSRGDVTKENTTKGSNQLTAKEVLHLEVIENFYKRAKDKKSLILQPVTFSDKKTHFLIEYLTDQMYIDEGLNKNGVLLSDVVKDLIDTDKNTRDLAKLHIQNEIRFGRGQRAKRQLINIFNRFNKQFEFADFRPVNMNMTYADIQYNIDVINKHLTRYNSYSDLRAAFTRVDLEEALDIKAHDIGNDKVAFELNPLLQLEASLYLDPNRTMFDRYMEERVRASAKNILKLGFNFDSISDNSLIEMINTWAPVLGSEWYDDKSRVMKAVRVLDASGKELNLQNDEEIESYLADNSVQVMLHPILEAYMLNDQLLSQSFLELLAGSTNSFTGKWSTDMISSDMSVEDKLKTYVKYIASNLSDEFKRTVLAGAIKTPYAQGKKYGVSSKWKLAVIDDEKASAYNYLGLNTKDKSQDGAGYVSPYVSKQENESLREGAVGEGIKKTFLNYVDPETGVLREIKWAEFTVTNVTRRSSVEEERKFQKMHGLQIDPENLQNFDISDYYNQNDIIYDGNRKLTHTSKLYYKERTNNGIIYYSIDGVTSYKSGDKTFVQVSRSIVDASGKLIRKVDNDKVVEINTIADLDSVFGGAYCMEYDDTTKKLEYSNANIDIVNNIICNHNLKDFMIAFVVNASAMKVGQVNVNNANTYRSNEPLKWFEMESRYAGVQMNADHEIDEANVSEMTQVMSSLIQAGMAKGVVNKIYSLIGRIAVKNMSRYTDVLEKGTDKDIYLRLGKLFASSFLRNDRDLIGLAESFVISAAKELNMGLDNTKIPFSSNQIKSIYQATITSTFNKLGIRRKFPGFGGINSPSYGRIQVFNFNGETVSFDEIQDRICNELQQKKFNGEIATSWTLDNVFNKQSSDGINIDNPYAVQIKSYDDLSTIGFEDTVIVRRKGDIGDGEVIRLKDINQLDTVVNFYDLNEWEIYKWTNQPKELRQSIDTIEITDGQKTLRIRWTDLDSVRASFYLRYYNPQDPYRDQKDEVINRVLAGSGMQISPETTESDRKRMLLYAQNRTQEFTRSISSGTYKGLLPLAYRNYGFGEAITFQNYHKARGQVVMGRANARVLGLQKGDKLSDIKDSSFFATRLANKFNLPLSSEYDPKLYDAVLYQQDGTPLLVVMGNVQTKLDRLDGCIPNSEYTVNSDGFIEYDGKELFESGGKAFFKSADGKYDIMVVDGPEAFKDVLDSRQYSIVRYNYNPSNWKTLVEFQNPTKFKNGILNSSFIFNGVNINQNNIDDPSVAIDLTQKEESSFANRISKLALKQYYAFKAQLSYILARIPSQSMQSFMDVDVILWIESELNEVYVPRALTFIQGSDYKVVRSLLYCSHYNKSRELRETP